MAASRRRLLEYVFIVPEAHFKLGNFQFQAEMYDVFHRRWGSRMGHMVCTPLVVTALYALLGLVPVAPLDALTSGIPVAPGLALPVALAMLGWFISIDRRAGPMMAPLIALALAAAYLLNELWGEHALRNGLILLYVSSFLQAFSHLFEEVPPPLSGSHRWAPIGTWLSGLRLRSLLVFAVMSVTVYPALECWASTRVWLLQVINVMMAFGYRPELRQALLARRPEILDDSRNAWRPEVSGNASAMDLANPAARSHGSP